VENAGQYKINTGFTKVGMPQRTGQSVYLKVRDHRNTADCLVRNMASITRSPAFSGPMFSRPAFSASPKNVRLYHVVIVKRCWSFLLDVRGGRHSFFDCNVNRIAESRTDQVIHLAGLCCREKTGAPLLRQVAQYCIETRNNIEI